MHTAGESSWTQTADPAPQPANSWRTDHTLIRSTGACPAPRYSYCVPVKDVHDFVFHRLQTAPISFLARMRGVKYTHGCVCLYCFFGVWRKESVHTQGARKVLRLCRQRCFGKPNFGSRNLSFVAAQGTQLTSSASHSDPHWSESPTSESQHRLAMVAPASSPQRCLAASPLRRGLAVLRFLSRPTSSYKSRPSTRAGYAFVSHL